ncbi:MAG TPA: rRNA pseudouridine synthase [Fibrobacteres bacterium]|jgi:23S rRNA pseudouridine2605 synthase|nr:rRNA pseudouridine synthase [Fibrobacterota bacterium]
MRLNRYLALCGLGSRRSVEGIIRFGRVTVNGEIAELSTEVGDSDRVAVDGKPVKAAEQHTYLLFNKPPGYLCSRGDTHDRETVYDLLPEKFHRLHYVGRLDRYSRGLLFFTSDGEWTLSLTHPRHGVLRVYAVRTRHELSREDADEMLHGIEIEPGVVFKCESIEPDDDYFLVSLREGKKREIRRMLQAIGHHVEDLQRIEFGGVKLGDLPEGRFRELTADELNRLAKL